MGHRHVDRLARARDLLSGSYDARGCVLACYSATGFTDDLRGDKGAPALLVTLDDIYGH
jgi:hypothetical protein